MEGVQQLSQKMAMVKDLIKFKFKIDSTRPKYKGKGGGEKEKRVSRTKLVKEFPI